MKARFVGNPSLVCPFSSVFIGRLHGHGQGHADWPMLTSKRANPQGCRKSVCSVARSMVDGETLITPSGPRSEPLLVAALPTEVRLLFRKTIKHQKLPSLGIWFDVGRSQKTERVLKGCWYACMSDDKTVR